METTTKTAEPIIGLFQMQSIFFIKGIEGISKSHAVQRMNDHTNHIAWLAGHIVSCRYMLANMIGLQVKEPYPELFGNLKGIDINASYPSLNELPKHFETISELLLNKLGAMSHEELHKDAFGGKLIDVVLFFVYHESYHIGQIGFLRKSLGYEPIKHG